LIDHPSLTPRRKAPTKEDRETNFNPDSAVGLKKSARHNLSALKSTGLCLSAFIDQRCFEGMLELHRDGVVERKIILKLRSRTPSLLQDCASLPPLLGFTAESGFNQRKSYKNTSQRKKRVLIRQRPSRVSHFTLLDDFPNAINQL
jgi:hypothetical protein